MQNNNTISIVALICGILGVLALFFSSMPLITWLLFLAAIAGVVLGAIGMTQSKGALGKASGMAIAGLILGIVGVCLGFIGVLCASCVCAVAGPMGCMNPGYADLVGEASQLSKYFN